VKPLAIAIKRQHVTLGNHAGIALLSTFHRGKDVAFNCVVREIGGTKIGASAAEQRRTFDRFHQHLISAFQLSNRELHCAVDPGWRDGIGSE
jgi:hypothetical protein